MTDTLIPMGNPGNAAGTPDAGGVRQQRHRRGQSKPRNALLSDPPKMANGDGNSTVPPDAFIEEKENKISDVVTRPGHFPSYENNDPVRYTGDAEFPPERVRHDGGISAVDVLAYVVAIALAAVAAYFSIRGMVVLFPGQPEAVMVMGTVMEAAKLTAAAWLGRRWGGVHWLWRCVLVLLLLNVASINAMGVYAQLVAAHVGEHSNQVASRETSDAGVVARIEVAASRVADLDRRLGQIDGAIEEATRRGRTQSALQAAEQQRKNRAGLAGEREAAARTLADLKAERAGLTARGKAQEIESTPIVYAAQLLGLNADPETVIRWLIAMIVMACDPLALALTAAAAARRFRGRA